MEYPSQIDGLYAGFPTTIRCMNCASMEHLRNTKITANSWGKWPLLGLQKEDQKRKFLRCKDADSTQMDLRREGWGGSRNRSWICPEEYLTTPWPRTYPIADCGTLQ